MYSNINRKGGTHFRIFLDPFLRMLLISFFLPGIVMAQKPAPLLPVVVEKGNITYHPDAVTGDRVPDYSYCGYKASEEEIPMIPVKIVVPPVKGDATATIQRAIDKVSRMPIEKNGFRGAVLLSKGNYEVDGEIKISASGVVLRGNGAQGETVILGKGVERNGLIKIVGNADKRFEKMVNIVDEYVPVNATSFSVEDGSLFKTDDRVIVKRPSTKEWIEVLGAETFGGGLSSLGWKPGDEDLEFDRTITAVNGNQITIDVPLTNSFDVRYGGGTVEKYNWPGRIAQIGIENLTLVSEYDRKNPKDENHRWIAINFENTENAWVRQVSFRHFAGSAVFVNQSVKNLTVEDCISTEPVSEIGGQRRNTFFTRGQLTLFQRCFSVNGYHDYSVGDGAAGPNAFVQCVSERPFSFNGTKGRWAAGVLFDLMSVDGNAIRVGNRWEDGRGAGWTGANCFFWNCTASVIECGKPPTAQNWAYGSWSRFKGNGFWYDSNNHLRPRSFFYAQLGQRLQKDVSSRAAILPIATEASSSPSVKVAQELTREAAQPKIRMSQWISEAAVRNPINTNSNNAVIVKVATDSGDVGPQIPSSALIISNGWLTKDSVVLKGNVQEVPWWTGGVEGKALQQAKAKLAITRFVPGRIGPGLTDDLREVIDSMKANNIVALNQHYGLWYDRRRDDHERVRRMDGDVWPPFYEQAFGRSGKDTAWDGLSKYDLTTYNTWYWQRMREFADLADRNGVVLLHQNYFQHNIIEAGAHYADFPWRTANNINHTGFVEPVNYAGEKRIFYAEQFYDVTNPVRKKLHQEYVRKCLENFRNNTSVIQFTSEEFTGPLHFVEFWLETIKNWQKETKRNQIIGLSATKDVQDAILASRKLSPVVNVIDIKYWFYQTNGELYAPEGGKNLAPRQWARLLKPKGTSGEQAYMAVKEYRLRYPEKAVIFSAPGNDRFGWEVFMAGGSLPALPRETNKDFLKAASQMKPSARNDLKMLSGKDGLIVFTNDSQLKIDLSEFSGTFQVNFINTRNGEIVRVPRLIEAGGPSEITLPEDSKIVWLSK